MKVLSLFDGMSCGQIALKQLGIIPEVYYASEINKHAIKQTQLNFPNTIHLGDVSKIDISKLESIDLLIGGSPCQSFSFAGKRVGMSTTNKEEIYTLDRYLELKNEGFRFEGESYLFWEYMRILTDIRIYNPNVLFLLENVEMGKKWERILSEAIGVYGVHINSALVSAQNRKRIYWTNIRTRTNGLFGEVYSDIPQPEDKKIFLENILESQVDDKYYLSEKTILGMMLHKERNIMKGNGFGAQFPSLKSNTLLARSYKDGKENLIRVPEATKKGFVEIMPGECFDLTQPNSKTRRGRRMVEKCNCLMAQTRLEYFRHDGGRIRRLTPVECSRLQTIPSWYRWGCSDTQIYKMLGNGWTVDVIVHILSFMKEKLNINAS